MITDRNQVTEMIIAAKVAKGLKWEEVAAQVGLSKEWVTAACLGQMALDAEQAEIIADIFLETWGREIELLRIGVNNQDAPNVERTAHSLKGTLATFCAEPAKRVAADLEIRARNKNLEGMTPDIDSLQREIQLLEPHIRAISIKGSR